MRTNIFIYIFILFTLINVNFSFAIEPGDKANDFKIDNYDGKTYKLSENKDASAIVLIFISTECPFVQPYTERLNSLASTYMPKNVIIWGINSNKTESTERVKEHRVEKGYPFPVLKDEGNAVADLFGATRTPEVFILDKNQTVLYHGRIDDNRDASDVTTSDLKNALEEILAGKEVTNKITKQFGCTIKR